MRRQTSDTGELERGRETAQSLGSPACSLRQEGCPQARAPRPANGLLLGKSGVSLSCRCSALGAVPPARLSRHGSSPVVSRTASPPSAPSHVTEPCPQCAATKPRHQTGVKVSFQYYRLRSAAKEEGTCQEERERPTPKETKNKKIALERGDGAYLLSQRMPVVPRQVGQTLHAACNRSKEASFTSSLHGAGAVSLGAPALQEPFSVLLEPCGSPVGFQMVQIF